MASRQSLLKNKQIDTLQVILARKISEVVTKKS